MPGIYLHIPFCRKACHYCDFHFSTSQRLRGDVLEAMKTEIRSRQSEFQGIEAGSLYFGGGTPSLLSSTELSALMEVLHQTFRIAADAEVTLEANPDDLDVDKLRQLKDAGINRLSIGIQSFFDEDLVSMNRVHTSEQALRCLSNAAEVGIDNVSVDLIFGLPGLTMERWQENVRLAFSQPITHLSCYGLTVEPRTALAHFIAKGTVASPDEDLAAQQYEWLLESAEKHGLPWYEISNFSRPGYESKHNSSYWKGEPYLGIGPSAHSYIDQIRSWNISNNAEYVRALVENRRPATFEQVNDQEAFHEFVLTSLRMRKGMDLDEASIHFGEAVVGEMMKAAGPYISRGLMEQESHRLRFSREGLLIADRITSDLFVI
ncbi:MAG: radical family heme chaperone HemW [Bacteroidota bacterium]|jgi:oxygen-independent coproporphyrinogen-3 oxidase